MAACTQRSCLVLRSLFVLHADTGVYHVTGLPLLANQSMHVLVVRVSVFSSQQHTYLSLRNLLTSLHDDPDLSIVPRNLLLKLFQTLFICTSCDYVSYFAGLGKSSFLRVFFQHSEFINSTSVGTLVTCM